MNLGQNISSIEATKTWSSRKEFSLGFIHIGSRVTEAMKEAFFPTRCLVCGSFFRNSRKKKRDLKTFLWILNDWKRDFFGSEGSVLQADLTKDRIEACLSTDKETFKALMSTFICTDCSDTYMAIESPICLTCGIVFESREGEDHDCGECLNAPKKFRIARSAGVYDKVLMAVIQCLKYKEKIQLAGPLGLLMFTAFYRHWNKEKINLIMPIPLHYRKLRKRGFNTSFLLVKEWNLFTKAIHGSLPVIPIAEDILVRKIWTKSQTGLSRKERLQNIRNAFVVHDSSKVMGKKILLVDDVYTTGATANECAKVLMGAGAAHVDVLTLARAM